MMLRRPRPWRSSSLNHELPTVAFSLTSSSDRCSLTGPDSTAAPAKFSKNDGTFRTDIRYPTSVRHLEASNLFQSTCGQKRILESIAPVACGADQIVFLFIHSHLLRIIIVSWEVGLECFFGLWIHDRLQRDLTRNLSINSGFSFQGSSSGRRASLESKSSTLIPHVRQAEKNFCPVREISYH